jgi:hypothetical protein
VYPNDKLLFGSIKFTNNTKKTLKIPKTFDLGIKVFAQNGQQLKPNFYRTIEYHNLFIFNRKMKISSGEELIIDFCEWRLYLFHLIDGDSYLLQYELNSSNYDEFRKVFGYNLFLSNREKFLFEVSTEKNVRH